jgi:hypothetical protein
MNALNASILASPAVAPAAARYYRRAVEIG